ncbi:hypothetical protein MNEG_10204, partial [Monoraphidium neglectum]
HPLQTEDGTCFYEALARPAPMAALMWLLVEATGPRGDGRGGGGGGGSEPLWLAAATQRDRRGIAVLAATLADGAMKFVSIRASNAGGSDDADNKQRRRSAVALAEAFCAAPGAVAALIAAATSEELLRRPDGPAFGLFWLVSHIGQTVAPLRVSEELTACVASQLEPCAAEAAALACQALRAEAAS